VPALPNSYAEAAEAFGRAVRDRREAKGLSQYQLAAIVDPPISRQQIHLIEHGKSGGRGDALANPELRTLISLCKALDARLVIDVHHPTGFVIEFVADPDQG
jgi:transcriptional regulator with XRE-family HTH domain